MKKRKKKKLTEKNKWIKNGALQLKYSTPKYI